VCANCVPIAGANLDLVAAALVDERVRAQLSPELRRYVEHLRTKTTNVTSVVLGANR
jgi:hypothetical protein